MINIAVTQVKESTNDLLESSLPNIKSEEGVTLTPTKRASAVLPAFNPNATTPAEIYDLSDIIAPDNMFLLTDEATAFADLKQKERKSLGFSQVILDLCENLPSQIDARRSRCVYILYLHLMLKLCKLASDKKFFNVSDMENVYIPKDVCKIFIDRYTSAGRNNKRTILSSGKDTLLAHCVVLLLSLNQYTFSFSKLLPEVSTTDQKLNSVCKALGCSVKRIGQTGEKIVALTSPPKTSTNSPFGSDRKRKRPV